MPSDGFSENSTRGPFPHACQWHPHSSISLKLSLQALLSPLTRMSMPCEQTWLSIHSTCPLAIGGRRTPMRCAATSFFVQFAPDTDQSGTGKVQSVRVAPLTFLDVASTACLPSARGVAHCLLEAEKEEHQHHSSIRILHFDSHYRSLR